MLIDKKEDCKYIQFRTVPASSYLTIKGECAGNMTFYENLIGITIRNTTLIFDLDDEYEEPREVNFIEGTDQLLTLDGFVNLGTIHLMVTSQKKSSYKIPKTVKFLTNEQVSLYFKETCIKKTVGKIFQTNSVGDDFKKNYSKSYSGNVFRTYSYLNLLDLEHAR